MIKSKTQSRIGEKAQITIFIILGMVLLASFALVFYIASESSRAKLSSQQKKMLNDIANSQAIQFYTKECLDLALKEGLTKIFMQGGYFHSKPGNIYPTSKLPYIERGGYNISYLIYPISRTYNDWYPCLSGENYPRYCEFRNKIPNEADSFSNSNLPTLFVIEEQLNAYIKENIKECLEKDLLLKTSQQYKEKITSGDVTVKTKINPEEIIVNADYPIRIEIKGLPPIIDLKKFKSSIAIKANRIYDVAEDLINKDIHYLNFDIVEDSKKTNYPTANNPMPGETVKAGRYPGISVKKERPSADTELIIINDSLSILGANTLAFQFARRNRPPVLDFISRYHSKENIYDYLAIQGENPVIKPEAADPDEDAVAKQDIIIPTAEAELGYKNLTMSVSDSALSDSQNVRILVDRKVIADADIYNTYADIAPNWASLEDPFYLNAKFKTTASLDPFAAYDYEWGIICNEGGSATLNGECLVLPAKENCENFIPNINTIGNNNLNLIGKNCQLLLRVNLSYSSGFFQYSVMPTKQFKITECIPHASSYASYPYNGSVNAFQANHTCCAPDGTIKPSSEICYNSPVYFCPEGIGSYRLWNKGIIVHCSGTRGNICNGDRTEGTGIKLNQCGCRTRTDNPECDNRLPYQVIPAIGWCYGTEGCSKLCSTEIVDQNDNGEADEEDTCGCTLADAENKKDCEGDFMLGEGDEEGAAQSFEGICESWFGLAAECIEANT